MKAKIRALLAEASTVTYHWRILQPFKVLRENGIDAREIIEEEEIPGDTDILILPRLNIHTDMEEEATELFRKIKENGTILVYDSDDDVWSADFAQYMTDLQWHPSRGQNYLLQLISELEKLRASALWTMKQCDAITVSTKPLAEYAEKLTGKPTFVVNNAIHVDDFEKGLKAQRVFEQTGYKTIGWAGGFRPIVTLRPMLEAWNILAGQRKDIKFVFSGWAPNLDEFANLNGKNIICLPWATLESYGSGMQVDIGCVSVGEDNYSLRKSVIKAWEFALAGALVVGSKALYHQEPIPYCESTKDWLQTLTFYLDETESRYILADTYKKYVKGQYDLKYNWVYWMDVYEKILKTVRVDERKAIRV